MSGVRGDDGPGGSGLPRSDRLSRRHSGASTALRAAGLHFIRFKLFSSPCPQGREVAKTWEGVRSPSGRSGEHRAENGILRDAAGQGRKEEANQARVTRVPGRVATAAHPDHTPPSSAHRELVGNRAHGCPEAPPRLPGSSGPEQGVSFNRATSWGSQAT